MGEAAIQGLNERGFRETYEPLDIVLTAREAMVHLPYGERGIALGTGPNTESWKQRGWETLDINPNAGADYTQDANYLTETIAPGSMDYVVAECITFDKKSVKGVGRGRLLAQANMALKPGGMVAIVTAYKPYKEGIGLPDKDTYLRQMQEHGFQAVAEMHTIRSLDKPNQQQRVIYYGRKMAQGHVSETKEQRPFPAPPPAA